jgi:hypothetical protein
VHTSWISQVEIFFSIVQRKVVKPQDFADLEDLIERLLAFQDRYKPPPDLPVALHRKSPDRHLTKIAA